MRLTVNEDNNIQLEEVYLPLVLVSNAGEKLVVCMRDSGFEITYAGKTYEAKLNELSFYAGH